MNNQSIEDREEVSVYELTEIYNEMLDDCYEPIDICGFKYSPSMSLNLVDVTAYQCGFNDYIDSLLSDDILVEIDGKYYRNY